MEGKSKIKIKIRRGLPEKRDRLPGWLKGGEFSCVWGALA
jgi:hypothetical protein